MKSIIAKLTSLVKSKKITKDKLFDVYLKIFYSESSSNDLEEYSNDTLLNLCFSSFNFFSSKKSEKSKVKIYNPTLKNDGFESEFTILDLINDDAPFLVDSIIMHFNKIGIEVKNIIHPIYSTQRSNSGSLVNLSPVNSTEFLHESVIQLHLSHINSNKELKEIEEALKEILDTVHLAVVDWKQIIDVAKKSSAQLELSKIKYPQLDAEEVTKFIDWICDNSFIFLGSCEFNLVKQDEKYSLQEVEKSNFGIFASKYKEFVPHLADYSSGNIHDLVKRPYLVEILKSRYISKIHRNVNAERIRIQKFDEDGNVIGEYRFIGLFTSSVYYQSANLIPIIRKKISKIMDEANFKKGGHSHKDLVSVLESYPRDELFQIEHADLYRISLGIVSMSGRSLVRFFVRNDKFERFVSCLIFIPRDHFNTYVKEEIHNLLEESYQGEILGSYIQVTESNLTRLQVVVKTDKGIPEINISEIEKKLVEISASWSDDLKKEISNNFDRKESKELIEKYKNAFSVSYTHRFKARSAIHDIKFTNKALESNHGLVFNLYESSQVASDVVEIKIYNVENKLQLSDMMPVLDSFGFNVIHEHTYLATPKDSKEVWIHYFNVNLSKSKDKINKELIGNFEDTIIKIYQGKAQIGHLNRMVVSANLSYRQVSLLRAYSKYLYQAGFRYSQKYIANTLVKYRGTTKLIIDLFETKFNPSNTNNAELQIENISANILKNLAKVNDNAEDLVLRRFVNIVEATTRTNYFQKSDDGNCKDYISFKFDSSKIHNLALPVPYAEIFVFSNDVEGVHLRGGKVARGGLRWSDRHEDFRTEVLGLVKAQMTKNAVIVPVGSKGGFVIKSDTSNLTREELAKVAKDCYKTFLRGILDITDNVVDSKIVYPEKVVRYDEDDPYLVVAADKGTATFSDTANQIAADYNFWLGDAFASGGSVGYDHKKMGITAKGAWISVQRHFNETGIDIQNQDFTCVAIGDMSGDVFGNGMLLSKHTKLVAAFNHMHIFIDPNPNTETSFKERQRMFNLPRSSWSDYNQKLISKGGGIYSKSDKNIKLSSEAMEALGLKDNEFNPNQLIKEILKSPVDLMWNGGIGTYVKASNENHIEVGDKFNDILRVNGEELRCKVVGEGGNLGLTQKGRIEYALCGGKINNDAIDNAAGVDCSDHEVNIKIALTQAMKSGKISLSKRNKILELMTDEVEELVLYDNKMQTQTISISESKGSLALMDHSRFIDSLEKIGLLNREVEFLPSKRQIERRQSEKIGMTRPELSVMLSYSKMDLYNNIINSELIKDKYFEKLLLNYFPKLLQKDFKEEISNHQLKSEIISTQITNMIVSRVGISFISQISKDNGFEIADIVRNIVIVCESFGLEKVWEEIEALNSKKTPFQLQIKMFMAVHGLLERSCLWLLRNSKAKEIGPAVKKFKKIISDISDNLDTVLAPASRSAYMKNIESYKKFGASESLAKSIAEMGPLGSAYDIIEVYNKNHLSDVKIISQIYFEVGNRLHLKWLRTKITGLNIDNYWQRISTKTILEDLYNYQMKITNIIVKYNCSKDGSCSSSQALKKWIKSEDFLIERYDNFIGNFKSQIHPDLSMFIVALNRIKALIS